MVVVREVLAEEPEVPGGVTVPCPIVSQKPTLSHHQQAQSMPPVLSKMEHSPNTTMENNVSLPQAISSNELTNTSKVSLFNPQQKQTPAVEVIRERKPSQSPYIFLINFPHTALSPQERESTGKSL